MPYESLWKAYDRWKIALFAVSWLIIISLLHYLLNFDRDSRQIIKMGYMPVITNLAAPLLDYATRNRNGIRYEALKFSSFAEMGEALRGNHIQAAFIIAPLSIVLHQQGADIKIVYIGNRHESTFVYRHDLDIKSLTDLVGRPIAVPSKYSGHHLCVRKLADEMGLAVNALNIVEINPPDMPSALSTGSLDGYFVGEPFAAKSLQNSTAKILFHVEDVWPDFICNLLIMRRSFIEADEDRAGQLIQSAARAGIWAQTNVQSAANIASGYWNQSPDLIQYALMTPPNRVAFDRFVPKKEEIQHMADLMTKFGLISNGSIEGLVEDKFALKVDLQNIQSIESTVLGNGN
jgi:NitT/TauT family transport system substrate-binding protein